jgi:uncharacterized membrane protein YfhO
MKINDEDINKLTYTLKKHVGWMNIIVDSAANKVTFICYNYNGLKEGPCKFSIYLNEYATDPLFEDIVSTLSYEEAVEKFKMKETSSAAHKCDYSPFKESDKISFKHDNKYGFKFQQEGSDKSLRV